MIATRFALVGEHRVGHAHLAEGQRHPERLAAIEQADDRGVGLALGLRVPVAVERRDERAAAIEVQLAHLVGAARDAGRSRHSWTVEWARAASVEPSSSPEETSTIAKLSGEAERSDTSAAGYPPGRRGTYVLAPDARGRSRLDLVPARVVLATGSPAQLTRR